MMLFYMFDLIDTILIFTYVDLILINPYINYTGCFILIAPRKHLEKYERYGKMF